MNSNRILVVDDEEVVREMISAVLASAGYPCQPAASGKEALETLHSAHDFALMLSDIMMPEMDGIELLKAAREAFPNMPVVMVTAVQDISAALNAVHSGAYDYITKPFERDQLLNGVRRALEKRRLTLENRAYQSNLESLVAARTEQLRQTMAELERSYDITLEALGDALDLKDAETEGHSKRVTAYTIAIARAMGLPANEVRVIARGAFLHDIGKMGIPDAVLRKPGPLTEDEIVLMREHCSRGYQMVRKIPFLTGAAEIVYAHQEHFDGTGYPRRLKGEEIPLGARIFAIADTLDAITSDRPYRAARSIQAAKEEIQRWSGRQFDPAIVSRFMSLADDTWTSLREQVDSQYKAAYFTTEIVDTVPQNLVPAQSAAEQVSAQGCEHSMQMSPDERGTVKESESQTEDQQLCGPNGDAKEAVTAGPEADALAVVPPARLGAIAQYKGTGAEVEDGPRQPRERKQPRTQTMALIVGVLLVLMAGGYSAVHRAATAKNAAIGVTAPAPDAVPAAGLNPQGADGSSDGARSVQSASAQSASTRSSAKRVPPASLQIEVEHHFTSADLSVLIDSRLAFTHSLHGTAKKRLLLLKHVDGFESDALKLSPGKHRIQVRIRSSAKGYDQSKTLAGTFVAGRQSTLRINLAANGDMSIALL